MNLGEISSAYVVPVGVYDSMYDSVLTRPLLVAISFFRTYPERGRYAQVPSIVAVTHGLSRAAIVKKIKEEHGVMNNVAFRKALKALVAREILVPKETGSAPAYRNFDAGQNWNSHGNSKLLRFHNDRKKRGTDDCNVYVCYHVLCRC